MIRGAFKGIVVRKAFTGIAHLLGIVIVVNSLLSH